MLITFKSRGHADVIMLGDIALQLIGMMGVEKKVPGVIEPEDIPRALSSLQQGIAAQDAAAETGDAVDADDDDDEPVSTHNRALPLIDLLTAAAADEVPVMWEEGGRPY